MCVCVCVCVCVRPSLQNLTYLAPVVCQLLDLQQFYRPAAAVGSPELTAQTEVTHPMHHPNRLHPKKLWEDEIGPNVC